VLILSSLVMVIDSILRKETKKPWLFTAGLGLVLVILGVVRGFPPGNSTESNLPTTPAVSEVPESPTLQSPEKSETPEEAAYRELVTEHAGRLLTHFNELLLEIQSPSSDSDWLALVKEKTEGIRSLCNEASGFQVTPSRKEVHSKYLEAMNHYVTYTHILEKGLKEQKPDILTEACVELDAGNDCIREANALLN